MCVGHSSPALHTHTHTHTINMHYSYFYGFLIFFLNQGQISSHNRISFSQNHKRCTCMFKYRYTKKENPKLSLVSILKEIIVDFIFFFMF
jgi:hypothetical protein